MREPRASDPLAERVGATGASAPAAVAAPTDPERVAIVDADSGRSLSYGELDAAVERTAGRLAALDVEPGDHVGLLADTGLPAVRTIYAALRLGAMSAPLNVRDTPAELSGQVETADLGAIVATPEHVEDARAAADAASTRPEIAVVGAERPDATESDGTVEVRSLADLDPAPFERAAPESDDVRLLLFTSGTTGDPKAVELTAGNLRSSALGSALRLGVEPGDRWLVPLSICHMGGFAPVFRSILYGTTAILQRETDPATLLATIEERDATCLSVVPTQLARLLDHVESVDVDEPASAPLSALRFVLSGGAATPPELVERCANRSVPVCPTYGVTETASQVATALPGEARAFPEHVGRPLVPIEVSIVDDGGDPLPAGEPGEIVVDGPTVSPGYYGDPEATAASRSARGYHTGDLGVLSDDGRLRVLGRVDDRIVTGGETVRAGEVEAALREHDAVADAAVVGLDDPEWGERVAALLARADNSDGLVPADVRQHCADRLAGYKQPRLVAVVDELPRTASGTVDRAAARERLRADGLEG